MDMKVQIIARETIKPSSPTPNHLLTHKLCILDQLAPNCYVKFILFYSATTQNSTKTSDHLKKSLAETLTHFYPFAGRVKNGTFIDCNDDGATFIEAHVANDVSMVLKQPDGGQLPQLLPLINPNENFVQVGDQEILAVQVNYFSCGTIAIGVCIHHVIGDASSMVTFVRSWAAITSGVNSNITAKFIDCTSLFPPLDRSDLPSSDFANKSILPKTVTKRLVFEGPKLDALKKRIGNGSYLDRPTRYEALSSLIWGAVISATRERDQTIEDHAAVSIVGLRNRLDPPLPQHCMGNICHATTAICPIGKEIDYNELAAKIRESIKKMSGEFVTNFYADGGFLNFVKNPPQELGKRSTAGVGLVSWCKIPYYEADFGWGKPIWVGIHLSDNVSVFFLDTRDGEGIEAWVGLPREDMVHLEQNPDIREFAALS